jgi:aspartate/methionine/tyrosine aminotransferase
MLSDQVAMDLGYTAKGSDLQMISFHSISKGFLGECGLRGGYFELFGIDATVKAQLYKLASISLCSNTVGQVPLPATRWLPPTPPLLTGLVHDDRW